MQLSGEPEEDADGLRMPESHRDGDTETSRPTKPTLLLSRTAAAPRFSA
jgi:hypothetical protein